MPLLDEAAELLGELDPAAGRGLAQQEHDRARDLANAKQTLVNMETAGVDVLMTAEELVDQNQEREARLTAAERATSDRTWAFGHIVVDEAQELSPMQWRLLVRRCPLKSFTIVGDIAQTSSVAGAKSWQGALAPMFGDRWQLEELTVNYRTPSQIAEAAARMANAAGLVVSAPKAVREGRGRRSSTAWSRADRQQARGGPARGAGRARRRPAGRDCRRRPAARRPPPRCAPSTAAASAPAPAATNRTSWSSARGRPRAWSSTASWCWNRRHAEP